MSTIYLLHILVCSDTEQSVLIPACHSLCGACRAVCFCSLGLKKKGADALTIQILALAGEPHTQSDHTRTYYPCCASC